MRPVGERCEIRMNTILPFIFLLVSTLFFVQNASVARRGRHNLARAFAILVVGNGVLCISRLLKHLKSGDYISLHQMTNAERAEIGFMCITMGLLFVFLLLRKKKPQA